MTGSFKVRGVANQFAHVPSEVINNKKSLVTMSAGNYGKAFAFASKKQNLPATVCMPETAPAHKAALIEVLYCLFFFFFFGWEGGKGWCTNKYQNFIFK